MSYWTGTHWERGDVSPPTGARPSRRRHVLEALAEGGLIALLVVGLVAGTTFAAKGGNSARHGRAGDSTLAGPVMVADNNGNGKADRGDNITFDVSTAATSRPNVGLRCYQNGMWIYDAYVGYYDGYRFDPWFTLDSSYWEKGVIAKCDARLFYNDKRGRQKVLATMSFNVGG